MIPSLWKEIVSFEEAKHLFNRMHLESQDPDQGRSPAIDHLARKHSNAGHAALKPPGAGPVMQHERGIGPYVEVYPVISEGERRIQGRGTVCRFESAPSASTEP